MKTIVQKPLMIKMSNFIESLKILSFESTFSFWQESLTEFKEYQPFLNLLVEFVSGTGAAAGTPEAVMKEKKNGEYND